MGNITETSYFEKLQEEYEEYEEKEIKENMNKKYIKQAFSHEGIQLGKGAIESIEYELKVQVSRMARRCKDGNLKRLTPELFWVALGRLNNGV